MAWSINYFPAAVTAGSGNGVPAGIYIPLAGLKGLETADLSAANRERRVAFCFVNQVYSALAAITNPLGIGTTEANPIAAGPDKINKGYSLTVSYYVDHAAGNQGVYPLPASNTGRVTLENLFGSNVAAVTAEGGVTGAGIVIPTATITALGGTQPANTGSADARDWLQALYASMIDQLEDSSSIITKSRSVTVGITPPANLVNISGITDAMLPSLSLFSHTFTLTVQIALDEAHHTFSVAA